MKIDRLISIVVYLLNHGRTSAQKLAEEFEVSSRTIMRGLESLDQAGIPIQSFYGVDGGYQIMDSFVLEKQVATSQEYDWIVTALKGMASAYASKSLKQALEKVQSISYTEDTAVSVDLGVASEDDKTKEQLVLLEAAIKEKCVVQFSYTNSLGLTLENVVQMNCLFKNIWDIPIMEKAIKKRFNGNYPVRKSFQTEFADSGNLRFQVDAIAVRRTKQKLVDIKRKK